MKKEIMSKHHESEQYVNNMKVNNKKAIAVNNELKIIFDEQHVDIDYEDKGQ